MNEILQLDIVVVSRINRELFHLWLENLGKFAKNRAGVLFILQYFRHNDDGVMSTEIQFRNDILQRIRGSAKRLLFLLIQGNGDLGLHTVLTDHCGHT